MHEMNDIPSDCVLLHIRQTRTTLYKITPKMVKDRVTPSIKSQLRQGYHKICQ